MSNMLCGRCKQELPLDSFTPTYRRLGSGWCKPCSNRYRAEWRARRRQSGVCVDCPAPAVDGLTRCKAHHDAHLAKCKAHPTPSTPERRAANAARARRYRQDNPERVRELERQKYAKNPDVYKSRVKRRRIDHPDATRASDKRHKDNRKSVVNRGDVPSVRAMMNRQKGRCYLCGCKLTDDNVHIEHVIPLSKEGEHSYANTRAACKPCNLHKHAALPDSYAQRTGIPIQGGLL